MICVSVYEPTADACLEALQDLDFAEVRIDAMTDPTVTDMERIFSRPLTLIATFRPRGPLASPQRVPGDDVRRQALTAAIRAGASYVDIEVESDRVYLTEIVAEARLKNCRIIVSYHNFDETPETEELIAIASRCFAEGADIAKIACMVNADEDKVRLLSLLGRQDLSGRTVVIGMGTKGRITRVAAPLLGSPFTYASLSDEKKTAGGQFDKTTLEFIFKTLRGELD